jgi:ribosomal protein S27AE
MAMMKCWNCNAKIPKKSKRCPECQSGQNLAHTHDDDELDFTRPDEAGFDEEAVHDNMFMSNKGKKEKKESCPVCGAGMTYKERVESWFCPKCKSFY